MIAKKNPKADLERKRFAFFQIGLLVAGSLCLVAFEYTTAKTNSKRVAYEESYPILEAEPVPDLPIEPYKKPKTQRVITLDVDSVIVVETLTQEGDAAVVTNPDEKIQFGDDGDDGDEYGPFELEEPKETIVDVPTIDASFPGGEGAMAEFINNNIELPNEIFEQGTIYLSFVVNRDGSIEQVKVLRGLSGDLDYAAKKVVKKMPRWQPGEHLGKSVRSRFTLPIRISTGY